MEPTNHEPNHDAEKHDDNVPCVDLARAHQGAAIPKRLRIREHHGAIKNNDYASERSFLCPYVSKKCTKE